MSIPGIGFTIGAVLIAKIGNISQFSSPKQLVHWAGLAPAVYESAGKPLMAISPSVAQNTFERLSSKRPM